MNYNKVIKDLKERNDTLAHQYRLRDIRCINLEQENEKLNGAIQTYDILLKANVEENQQQKEVIDKTINAIDLVIELIKQQPTKDDRWILDRLNGFKIILENKEVSE